MYQIKRNKVFFGDYFFRKTEKFHFTLTCFTSVPLHSSVWSSRQKFIVQVALMIELEALLRNSLYKRWICCVKSCYCCEVSSEFRCLANLFIFGMSGALVVPITLLKTKRRQLGPLFDNQN